MGGTKWTNEQITAITTRNCNLLVSAAAGAGKTAVLVERIIRRIVDPIDPVDVDRLLIVTFTKAAANEMRERIGLAIARELDNNPASLHLNRQATLLSRAYITTLHSFCLDVVRQYFYRLELDPAFRVADDAEAALMLMETLEELFEELYSSGDEEFLALVDAYGGERDDSRLHQLILDVYRFAVSNPWPEYWLDKLEAAYKPDSISSFEQQSWVQILLQWAELQLSGCLVKLKEAEKLALRPGGPAAYLDNLRDDMVVVHDLLAAARSWDGLHRALQDLQFGKLKACRNKDIDETLKERTKKLREEAKKTIASLSRDLFARPLGEHVADLERTAPYVRTVAGLVRAFMERYREMKTARGLVDFSDLEHYCLKVLLDEKSTPQKPMPSPVALELREYFAEVLVDEYQDINAVQETILHLVSRQGEDAERPNLFMVGDVKQSIYRFRLAEPSLFMSKYLAYPRTAGEACRAVDLTQNFRSRREVIDAVNYIFRQIMTQRLGELIYDNKAELHCGALYADVPGGGPPAGGPVELHLLEKKVDIGAPGGEENEQPDAIDAGDDASNSDDDPAELDATQREARLVARRIKELVSGTAERPGPQLQVFDKTTGGYHPVRYRDIVILMRATRGAANIFVEELRGAGIPVYADLDTGYFAATEIEIVMSLLKIIDNPRQDIPLAAVLRSPIVGLTAEELALVRLCAPSRNSRFYDAVQAAAADGPVPEPVKTRLQAFLTSLEQWRTMARQGSLAGLVWRLYNETGYYTYVGGMPGGMQRQANLRALYDRARQYEATAYRGLFRFLRFIERFQDLGNDLGTARALGENEDVVRIMSIHKSKGLEFPVVIVAGLGKQFNTVDLRQNVVLHKELGIGLPVVEPELPLTYPSLVQSAIRKKNQMEMLAEEMRVLYVALTRAREKLILIGSAAELEKCAAQWCQNVLHKEWPLPDVSLAGAKSFLDWICPAVARHREGQAIRDLAGCDEAPAGEPAEDRSFWSVRVWRPGECLVPQPEEPADYEELLEKVRKMEPVDITAGQTKVIGEALSWKYPFALTAGKPSKAAVTEIKNSFAGMEMEETHGSHPAGELAVLRKFNFIRPRFYQNQKGLTAAERGSAVHLVMQHVDLRGDLTEQGIAGQLARMQARELLTAEQAKAINPKDIAGFFNSEIGRRMLRADEIYRELPFTVTLPAEVIYSDLPAGCGEAVLVQGVIDCLLKEGDGFVLLDYKTDRLPVEKNSPPAGDVLQVLADKYRGQLNIYAMAVERILRKPVRAKYIYLFAVGKTVEIV